jgi:hypothetical protein
MFDRELNLLIATCRNAYGGGPKDVERFCDDVDWRHFLHLARRHRVQALSWHGLGPAQGEASEDIAGQLTADSIAIVEANLRAAAECVRLKEQFDRAGVDLLFLKGLTVGALAYPNPFLKMGWDVDVLVAPDTLGAAVSLLRSGGYLPAIPASASDARLRRWHKGRKESVWHDVGSGIHLELHTRLTDHPSLVPGLGMQSPSQLVKITDQISLPTLAKDELFAYLCVHGASSAWFRLKWITDLAAMLHGEEASEVDRLYICSQRLGAGRAAAQALLLAHRFYDSSMSADLAQRLEAEPANRWLTDVACRQLADSREPTEHFLGTASIRLSQLPLLPGVRFPLSEGFRQVREIASARLGWG